MRVFAETVTFENEWEYWKKKKEYTRGDLQYLFTVETLQC